MGHTVSSQRMLVEDVLTDLKAFGKALRADERVIYEEMLKSVYKHLGAVSYASSFHVWAFVLISIILEEKKQK